MRCWLLGVFVFLACGISLRADLTPGPRSDVSRVHGLLSRAVQATVATALSFSTSSSAFTLRGPYAPQLSVPLERFDGLFTLNFTVDNDRRPYRAIVDTGSPFLMIPSVCSRDWGCVDRAYRETGLAQTVESFGGQEYDTLWKTGDVKFLASSPLMAPPGQSLVSASLPQGQPQQQESARITFRDVVFGSVGADVLRRPGGVFCGLVKYRAERIRPTLLGQIGYNSLRFDAPRQMLTLSKTELLSPQEDAIAIFDLRSLGSPIQHYACKVKRLLLNDREVLAPQGIYAIFDTGTTGCVLSDDITLNDQTPVPPRKVTVVVETESGRERVLEAGAMPAPRIPRKKDADGKSSSSSATHAPAVKRREVFVVSSARVPWKAFMSPRRVLPQSTSDKEREVQRRLTTMPQLVVLGLAFLSDSVLTVDVDRGRLLLDGPSGGGNVA